jgi:hypothetical protein
MNKVILFTAMLLLTAYGHTKSYDIDIDWPTSTSNESMLAITVNKCETRFTIKNGDLVRFEKSTKDLDEVLRVAIKRYEDGCR